MLIAFLHVTIKMTVSKRMVADDDTRAGSTSTKANAIHDGRTPTTVGVWSRYVGSNLKDGAHNAMDDVSAILKDDDTPNLSKATQREFVPFRESFTSSNATTHCPGSAYRIFHNVMTYNIHERAYGTQQQYHQQDCHISSLQSV